MSAQRPRGFTTTDNPYVTAHAREQWAKRGDDSIPVDQAWREATSRNSGHLNARFERVHEATGCTLIACRIHPGQQARVILRTVLGPDQEVVDPGPVDFLLADHGGDRR